MSNHRHLLRQGDSAWQLASRHGHAEVAALLPSEEVRLKSKLKGFMKLQASKSPFAFKPAPAGQLPRRPQVSFEKFKVQSGAS